MVSVDTRFSWYYTFNESYLLLRNNYLNNNSDNGLGWLEKNCWWTLFGSGPYSIPGKKVKNISNLAVLTQNVIVHISYCEEAYECLLCCNFTGHPIEIRLLIEKGPTLSQKQWLIPLLIMKCRRHSSYGMKLFIPLDEWLLHFIINNEIINHFWDSVYSLADIYGTDHFRTKLAPQPYNKLESCVV
jgi:hypothetical protein